MLQAVMGFAVLHGAAPSTRSRLCVSRASSRAPSGRWRPRRSRPSAASSPFVTPRSSRCWPMLACAPARPSRRAGRASANAPSSSRARSPTGARSRPRPTPRAASVCNRNWRKHAFVPAAQAAGLNAPRPYDLRHSFVSLLINEGVSIVEVARQAGHLPGGVPAHLRAHLRGVRPRRQAARRGRYRHARSPKGDSDVRVLYACADDARTGSEGFGSTEPSRRGDSNPRPPLYESGALAN
jgi:hypothetical protein